MKMSEMLIFVVITKHGSPCLPYLGVILLYLRMQSVQTEVVSWRCSMKKLFLAREKTCAREEHLYNKVADLQPAALMKETPAQAFFSNFWKILKSSCFVGYLRTAASLWRVCYLATKHFLLRPLESLSRMKQKFTVICSMKKNFTLNFFQVIEK